MSDAISVEITFDGKAFRARRMVLGRSGFLLLPPCRRRFPAREVPPYLDECRACGQSRGNHRWPDQACPGGKKTRRGFSAWRGSRFHKKLGPPRRRAL